MELSTFTSSFTTVLALIVYANVLLGVFNLVPIPPLDGSKVLFPLLGPSWANFKDTLERYGFIILLIFLFTIGFRWILPIILALYRLFAGGAPLPLQEMSTLIFFFIIIVPSAIIHEYMHGFVANHFGDPTAKYAGRLTLNPVAHIDLWGTILMPLTLFLLSGGSFLFAYAKPVPVNPMLLRGRYAGTLVAAAGPLANFATAAVIGVLMRLLVF